MGDIWLIKLFIGIRNSTFLVEQHWVAGQARSDGGSRWRILQQRLFIGGNLRPPFQDSAHVVRYRRKNQSRPFLVTTMRKLISERLQTLSLNHVAIPVMMVVALLWLTSAQALFLGIAIALLLGNPFAARTKPLMQKLLAFAIVGLGFGTDLVRVGQAGVLGMQYTLVGLLITFSLGLLLGKILRTPKNTSILISVGTGICGGSAIAAVAPVINARSHEVAVSLATVFVLNSTALLIFPFLGHYFDLSQADFGLFCALAIHDTSSVLGAAMQFGERALEVGTTIKLARALWIVPVAFVVGLTMKNQPGAGTKAKIPWFIFGFVAAAALVTLVPEAQPYGHYLEKAGRRLMVAALFLIGAGLTKDTLRQIGLSSFVQGFMLWIIMGTLSLYAITAGWLAHF